MENSQPPHVNDSHTSQQHAHTFSMVDPSAYAQPQPPPQPNYVQPRHAALEEPDEEQLSSEEEEEEEEEEEAIDPAIVKDMEQLQRQIPGFRNHYRLIKRIGEGTFSTVYKAEDLLYDNYDNSWDFELEDHKWEAPPIKTRHNNRPYTKRQPKFVAIKKIYVTSSPQRILNELELLHDLRGCEAVCPLITAFRYTDQVLAVLPYFRHTDFRDYFRHMTMRDTSMYLRLLFIALENVHEHHILHRDIKPTNFLYNPKTQRGVLVDFGLAEREGVDGKPCVCHERPERRRERIESSLAANSGRTQLGYPEHDTRPSRRANRAGTRGFRAPEVLFKCTEQTTKLDIWSAGVILLTIMSKRFPFFNSSDDVDALIEISTIFGTREMKKAGLLHGCVLETTLPTIGTNGFTLEKIILWSTCRTEGGSDGKGDPLNEEELLAVDFLKRCMTLDPSKRLSAKEALQHDFLRLGLPQAETDEELNLVQPPAHSFDA
ncbi:Cell cycle serine/threonine-protein kinase hsk1 [Ceratocystis fimbriata CBS 114723]|uniref:non-specific serine/threonine protein kinase n=1 Tax=Ceratocystis fimbriata CBS 114723 TaxID=1035309 RepID=A0A2C5XJU4_9PEZI|nr:Cell cycle serine/threonine-protein kinase hsk1 [Ceratocystis fimbriata CBS 114723]